MEVKRDRNARTLYLSQGKYTREILERFPTTGSDTVITPVDPKEQLTVAQCPAPGSLEASEMAKIPYREAVGSLLYLAIATRPDIAYAVGQVSKYGQNPGLAHWRAVMRIFKYLRGTSDYALRFAPSPTLSHAPVLSVWADASFAREEKARSTTGFVIFVGDCPVSWGSRRQTTVATSSSEAEWVAAFTAGKDAAWARKFMQEIGYPQDRTPFFSDSEASIAFGTNGNMDGRMRHMNVAYYWLLAAVNEEKQFTLLHVPGVNNTADIFTKGLGRTLHDKFVKQLGLIRLSGTNHGGC